MKKKLVAGMLATAMVASVFTGCGKKDDDKETKTEAKKASVEVTADDKGEIKLWVADNTVDFTKGQVDKFLEANPNYKGYTVSIEPVGEGDAATNMITDVTAGADIYGFAQDQLARLVSAGAIAPVSDESAKWISDNNDAGAAGAAVVGGTTYAFPLTSDNGYFLYYDKSVVKDPSTLEAILSDCEAAGKGFYMEINSGWYDTAFFFATGCKLEYGISSEGKLNSSNITYATDEGVKAMKAMINLHKSKAFYNGSAVGNAANAAAVVSGTWDSGAAQDMFGANYACAKLPTFNVDGKDYQMSGFGGFKLLGIKPQTDQKKYIVCQDLAKFLSNEETQLARFEAVGWGPSNKNAQASEKVKADPALSALAEQLAFTIPQGQYPNEYWDLAKGLGDSIIAGDYDKASDDDLKKALQDFQTTCESYAK
ncbi:arabinogalactan oligomer / maltooligosaccharide transport system substrate-binding protein [Eubacterium ruminantium]|nr:arabinogalactan oligomer / maltooligosaccharide transport system substrate-binding protein [Eubacterium ruminantium]